LSKQITQTEKKRMFELDDDYSTDELELEKSVLFKNRELTGEEKEQVERESHLAWVANLGQAEDDILNDFVSNYDHKEAQQFTKEFDEKYPSAKPIQGSAINYTQDNLGRGTSKSGQLLRYLVEGYQMAPDYAQKIFLKMYNAKAQTEREYGSREYIGTAGGPKAVRAKVTGMGRIVSVEFLDPKIKSLPQKYRDNFIVSAVSDAINQSRSLMYKTVVDINRQFIRDIYQGVEEYEQYVLDMKREGLDYRDKHYHSPGYKVTMTRLFGRMEPNLLYEAGIDIEASDSDDAEKEGKEEEDENVEKEASEDDWTSDEEGAKQKGGQMMEMEAEQDVASDSEDADLEVSGMGKGGRRRKLLTDVESESSSETDSDEERQIRHRKIKKHGFVQEQNDEPNDEEGGQPQEEEIADPVKIRKVQLGEDIVVDLDNVPKNTLLQRDYILEQETLLERRRKRYTLEEMKQKEIDVPRTKEIDYKRAAFLDQHGSDTEEEFDPAKDLMDHLNSSSDSDSDSSSSSSSSDEADPVENAKEEKRREMRW
jgi:hypothetical protein